jgi:hypothetical protein
MCVYHIFIFSFIFFEIYSEPLKLKFKTRFNKENMNQGNVMEMLINNDIIIPISFGSNEQIIEMNVKLQKDSTFILSNKCRENTLAKKFYKETSKSYEELIEENKYFMYEFNVGVISKDKIVFFDDNKKNITINDFIFVLANQLWSDAQADMSGMLGLILSNKDDKPKITDFVTQLKQNKIIDSYTFMLEYTNEYDGILYLGDYFNGSSNAIDDLKTTLVSRSKSKVKQWEITTDKIFSGNTVVQNDTYIQFHYEMGILAAPEIYRDYIKANFFKNYLDKGICKLIFNLEEISIFNKYDYIACNKNEFKSETFPEIKFYSQDLNFNFTLNYKDLFYEFGNKVYFLAVFPRYPVDVKYWYIGKPFFLKYKLFMNKDKKTIGLYKNYNKNKKEVIVVEIEANKNKILYILIIIFLVCVLIGILYYFLKVRVSRKLRANELEDRFSYNPIKENKKETKKVY